MPLKPGLPSLSLLRGASAGQAPGLGEVPSNGCPLHSDWRRWQEEERPGLASAFLNCPGAASPTWTERHGGGQGWEEAERGVTAKWARGLLSG